MATKDQMLLKSLKTQIRQLREKEIETRKKLHNALTKMNKLAKVLSNKLAKESKSFHKRAVTFGVAAGKHSQLHKHPRKKNLN